MMRSIRKFIAVLMLLWLPVSTGSALAASVAMQLPQADCHETMAMPQMDMGGHHMHHEAAPVTDDRHGSSCDSCGICHLACTGYLAAPNIALAATRVTALEATPYLLVYQSFTSAPLVPPPLAHA